MSALGKGLGSLIPTRSKKDEVNYQSSDAIFDNERIEHIPIDKIAANPWQPRTHFDRDKLEELAQSIKQHGILQPLVVSLVVSKEGNSYQLIAGERRLKAAQILNLKEVPVIIKEATDRDKLELSIVENIQRRDLNPLETANSYQRLMEEFGLTVEEIGQQVGKHVSTVTNFLRLLKLPIVIKEALAQEKITFSHAKLILSYPTKEEQIRIYKEILKKDLTTKQLEDMTKKAATKAREAKPRDPVIASWEDKLTRSLGAKVIIDKKGEKGQIKINFFSHAELKNILDKLT